MILVLATPRDEHAQTVLVELSKMGAQARLIDLSEFPQRMALAMRYSNGGHRFSFGCDQSGLDLDDCGAIWWRRPQSSEISPDIARMSHRHFALTECTEALTGLWHALDAFWINEPARDMVAHRKSFQLRVAQEVGLEVPDTLITNCPSEAHAYISRRGSDRVIYKAFSGTEQEWRETRVVKDDELALIDNVRYAPVIFQEYVDADVDLRITVIGDEVFPAAIHSRESAYKFDFRMDMGNARVEATELPDDVERKLLMLMKRLGLVYGAIDMRRTADGRHVFLEINPAGQWLFIEHQTRQPIASSLARLLMTNDA